MSGVKFAVSDEFDAWLVTKVGFVDFRAIRVSFLLTLVDTDDGCFQSFQRLARLRRLVALSAVE